MITRKRVLTVDNSKFKDRIYFQHLDDWSGKNHSGHYQADTNTAVCCSFITKTAMNMLCGFTDHAQARKFYTTEELSVLQKLLLDIHPTFILNEQLRIKINTGIPYVNYVGMCAIRYAVEKPAMFLAIARMFQITKNHVLAILIAESLKYFDQTRFSLTRDLVFGNVCTSIGNHLQLLESYPTLSNQRPYQMTCDLSTKVGQNRVNVRLKIPITDWRDARYYTSQCNIPINYAYHGNIFKTKDKNTVINILLGRTRSRIFIDFVQNIPAKIEDPNNEWQFSN